MSSRAALAVALAVAALGCGQTRPEGNAIVVAMANAPVNLDPRVAADEASQKAHQLLYDTLVRIDDDLRIVPQLAESYQWSGDGKALTIKVRPGVTFHDGEKLDAAAVKFNIERHKTMQGSNRRGELSLVASVDVVDPMTARLNLSQPFSPLPER